jgi:hypothetical protein
MSVRKDGYRSVVKGRLHGDKQGRKATATTDGHWEYSYTADEIEFGRACEREQRRLGTVCLDCRQRLEVLKRLGYRKDGVIA